MLKYANFDIVFQEFPDEVTLALNISGCPNGCPGCHSAYLQGDVGDPLTVDAVAALVNKYDGVTCVGLMGGDARPDEVAQLAEDIKARYDGKIKTGWYSGRQNPPQNFRPAAFNYVKFGPYREALGPLKARTTNQRLYRVEPDTALTDITSRFWLS